VHGDFAEWNVHYERGELSGVIDFGLTHLDSRPYELAIARAYRAPELVDGYRAGLAAGGWPLSDLEEAALTPVYQAFRVDMAAWLMGDGRRTGRYDLTAIERQLSRTGTSPPLRGFRFARGCGTGQCAGEVLAAIVRLRASSTDEGFVICDAVTGARLGNIALHHDGSRRPSALRSAPGQGQSTPVPAQSGFA
jgi:Phosphotransferase enzyme family